MSYQQRLNKMGATPGKLALIGVLALVLVLVIVKQLPESVLENSRTEPVAASKQLAKTEKTRPTNLTTKDPQQESEMPSWPEMDLTETLANDPFAPPSWAVEEEEAPAVFATEGEPGELAALQEQGASIVVISQGSQRGTGKKSATIGEQKLFVGDILEGYRVTDITTQGIFLNKLDPR